MTATRARIGRTDLEIAPLAVGTWAWGEGRYWGYEADHGPRDGVDAFAASADAGLDLFDTAEVYGDGESEKILGWLARKLGGRILVATKFGLLPGRDARTLPRALDASLTERIARLLVPVLTDALRRRALTELGAALSRLLADPHHAAIRVSGPQDLLDGLAARLGPLGAAVAFAPADLPEVQVSADQTVIETQLGAWTRLLSAAIEEA